MKIRAALPLLLSSLLAPAAHAADADPLARTRALIALFEKVQTPADGAAPTAAMREANAATYAALDGFFDREALTTTPIAPHRAKFSDAQAARFGELFWALLRLVAYPDSGAFLREAETQLAKAGDASTRLKARLPKDDLETEVVFHWKPGPDGLRVVDVDFDGASLMKDYQNQFGRLIAKHGVDGLIAKLEARRADEEKKRGALP